MRKCRPSLDYSNKGAVRWRPSQVGWRPSLLVTRTLLVAMYNQMIRWTSIGKLTRFARRSPSLARCSDRLIEEDHVARMQSEVLVGLEAGGSSLNSEANPCGCARLFKKKHPPPSVIGKAFDPGSTPYTPKIPKESGTCGSTAPLSKLLRKRLSPIQSIWIGSDRP